LWLIGLGLLVLIGNVAQDWGFDWSLSGRWVAPVVLAVLSVYLFTRRLGRGVRLACILRWPVILMVLAVLLALQAADVVPLWKTWSVLLVAIGAVLLLERTAGAGVATPVAGYVSPVPASAPPTAAEVDAERTRAAWAATEATPAAPVHDEKGGF
jgi:hypothetical protein